MDELQRALSEIHSIRYQVARGTQFRGYGPASIAFSGLLAVGAAFCEVKWGGAAKHDFTSLTIWIGIAALSVAFTGIETFTRARRVHCDQAEVMIRSAVEQFMPALAIGVLLTVVMLRVAPEDFWLLPGLWELIFSLGIFASCRFLPRQMFGVGVWYLAAGLSSIAVASAGKAFMPWTMGLPFGIGQLLVAGVLCRWGGTFEEA